MAGRDLRALFGSNDRVGTDEAFTNRERQWAQVAAAVSEHLRRISDPGFDVQDLETARRNVLVFHGIGGIGKSTLSRKVEAALGGAPGRPAQWGEPSWPTSPVLLPVRIDLARSAGVDFERLVLTLRMAFAGLDRAMPAFDLALLRYWGHNHPGESLEEYLRRAGLVHRLAKALPGQVQGALSKAAEELALPGAVGSAVGQVTTAVVRAVRERRTAARALAGCPRLADLLEAEPDLDALSFYPHLLAYELDRLPEKKKVAPIVLLDTFEDVGDRTHRDLERLVQRVVWLMPNALFVITGRSRLQWADPALQGQLDYTGPAAWPQLAAHLPNPRTAPAAPRTDASSGHTGSNRAAASSDSGNAVGAEDAAGAANDVDRSGTAGTEDDAQAADADRQVLIGDFSPEDRDDYLARRLAHTDGRPLIEPELRAVIAERSHGLPLYLDLAVQRFLEIRRTRTPEPADVDHDFPALLARTMQDLTEPERHVLRAACLLDAFDIPLATAAAGLPREAPARRLVERPLVLEHPAGLWPYHLHGVVRSTLRHADDRTDDSWSEQDWHVAAQRAFTAIGDRWTNSTAGPAAGPGANPGAGAAGRVVLVACLRQGLRLARDHRLDLGWLTDAAWAYIGDSVWEPLAPPSPAPSRSAAGPEADRSGAAPATTPADMLVETLSALTRRQQEHRARTVQRLAAVVDSRLLPEDLHLMALYYLAKAQRDLGHRAGSRHGMQTVADSTSRLAPAARRGLVHLLRLAGDFPAAHQAAQHLGWKGREQRVLGDIHWPHALLDRAADHYLRARTEAEQHAIAGERATSQAQRAFTLAFTDPAAADDEIDLATQLLNGLTLTATTFTVATAALIRVAGTDAFERPALQLRADTGNAGIGAARAAVELAFTFHHAVTGDQNGTDDALARLREITAEGDHRYYLDIARFMAGQHSDTSSDVRWLEDERAVRSRWRALVTDRRAGLPPL
ncbi:ATP/GTP-binding protein [Kitasatospora sp. CB01950]|uniref:ATP/GTP-binding protein n=1 Tax=Kitasatospora sp. CB01950 TaxID=1703930 RepID=UPI00096295C5|nr:ATP/GTP-binding protein [Kitasatospora sp. CB01950]OKI95105.1 ATP/GTP-binding protein [Kitasatospora sp. CB01950]